MRRGRLLIVAVVALGLAAIGVRAAVRAYVDGRIERHVGATLPSFSLRDTTGRTWTEGDLRGRVVVLNFTRSFCPNCEREKPALRALAEELDPEDVLLLSVTTDRVEGFPEEATARTLERAAFRHPVLIADAAFVDAFHGAGWAHVTPITYVADEDGRIVETRRGTQSLESLRAAIAAAR